MERPVEPTNAQPWIVTSAARTVFEHRFYPTVVEEDVCLPDGNIVSWLRYADHREEIELADGVVGICIRGDEVLLANQFNPAAGRAMWEFPGGWPDAGEAVEDALRRELMEEVGLFPHRLHHLGRFLWNNRRSGRGVHVYLATELEERFLPSDDSEFIQVRFVKTAGLDEMIRAGEIENSNVLASWALFKANDPTTT